MKRTITGFHRDPAEDWVAELVCGHGQHVRHKPPFFSRPWILTVEGRHSRLGVELDCVRCDRFELPEPGDLTPSLHPIAQARVAPDGHDLVDA